MDKFRRLIKSFRSKRSFLYSTAALFVILFSLPVGVYFVQNQNKANLFPKAATFPTNERPKYQGYIVELKDAPALSVDSVKKTVRRDETLRKRANLSATHAQVKKSLLKRLNKKMFVESRKVLGTTQAAGERTDDAILVLGEYTDAFNGIALDITDSQAQEIRKDPSVKRVTPNYQVKATLMDSVPLINADKVWQLKGPYDKAITGEGINVAVIDTGVDYTHPDLGGCTANQVMANQCPKVLAGYDFVNQDNDPLDDNGHGTHVASTIASSGSLKGVAPGAKIVPYKVLDSGGSGSFANVISGIDAAVKTRGLIYPLQVSVVNMSLGAGCWGTYDDGCGPGDPVSQAVDRASEAGIVMVISAGNSGSSASTVGSPGTARTAITVAAASKDKQIAYFSSRGPVIWKGEDLKKPDITAPGVKICAAKSSGGHIGNSMCFDDKHILLSGTSMAAPHVAGVAALILQNHIVWTPQEVKGAIIKYAADLGFDNNSQGAGLVDALASVTGTPPIAIPTPTATASPSGDCRNLSYPCKNGLVSFPADEGSHKEKSVEWWYANFNGKDTSSNNQNLTGALALARLNRGGTTDSGAALLEVADKTNQRFIYRILTGAILAVPGKQDVTFTPSDKSEIQKIRFYQTEKDFHYQLDISGDYASGNIFLTSTKRPLVEGGSGFVPIFPDSPEEKSGYYSLTRLNTSGRVKIGDQVFSVTGTGWIDHQWFNLPKGQATDISQLLRTKPSHEWLSVQLDNNTEIVAWEIFKDVSPNGKELAFKNIDILDSQGNQTHSDNFILDPEWYWNSPNGGKYAQTWRFHIPEKADLKITTTDPKQYLDKINLFEGSIDSNGYFGNDRTVNGQGYAEMTLTYDPSCKPSLEVCDGRDNDCDFRVDEFCQNQPTPIITPIPNPLPGDINGDGKVDVEDMKQLLGHFTNIFDYNLVVGNYGKSLNPKP